MYNVVYHILSVTWTLKYFFFNVEKEQETRRLRKIIVLIYNGRKEVSYNHIVFTVITKRTFNRGLGGDIIFPFWLMPWLCGAREESGGEEGKTE